MFIKILFSIILLSFVNIQSFAFELTPMKAEFTYSGKNSLKYFQLLNSSEKVVDANIEILKINHDLKNNEIRDITQDFEISPQKITLLPGKMQKIKVKYIGKNLSREHIYRLTAKTRVQNISSNDDELAYSLEYDAAIYVTPSKAKADIKIENSYKSGDYLEITFENRGEKHILLKRYEITLRQGNQKRIINFKKKEFKELGSSNIFAGLKRKIVIKDQIFQAGKVEARFVRAK